MGGGEGGKIYTKISIVHGFQIGKEYFVVVVTVTCTLLPAIFFILELNSKIIKNTAENQQVSLCMCVYLCPRICVTL